MVGIAIQGIGGRMGRELVSIISARSDCNVVAGIDPAAAESALPCPVYAEISGLDALDAPPDVLIDFSHPSALNATLNYCKSKNLPCVTCTTGLSEEQKSEITEAAKQCAVFYSANMSLGINLAKQLVKRMQAVLQGFDIEIVEKHHNQKLDAPSGTALMLADAINEEAGGKYNYVYDRHELRQKRDENELGIHAVRGGSIVGEHDVIFAGRDEVITLSHTAYSRSVFANGAVAAAIYLKGKPAGLYNMDNIINEV